MIVKWNLYNTVHNYAHEEGTSSFFAINQDSVTFTVSH